jgi:hypothetical protein
LPFLEVSCRVGTHLRAVAALSLTPAAALHAPQRDV